MKPMTKQLTTGALILASVTVLSFGIRQVRFSLHRARHAASAPATAYPASPPLAGDSGQSSVNKHSGDNARREQALDALAEQAYRPSDSNALQAETYQEHANASGWEAWADDRLAPRPESGERADSVPMDKSFKGDDAKSKGSNGLQKISLGAYENIYITGTGEHWYVSKQPDGTTTKMQLQVEDRDGEVVIAGTGEANVYRPGAGGSNGLQRIPVGANENVYITETGEHWYVSTQPDGTTTKVPFQVEDR